MYHAIERPIFVVVTSRGCQHCRDLKSVWSEYKEAIEKTGLIEVPIIDIEVNNNREKPDTKVYPRDLHRYLAWYPSFALIRSDSWYRALPGPGKNTDDAVLKGIVFNGRLTPKKVEQVAGPPATIENILHWIRVHAPGLTEIKQLPVAADSLKIEQREETETPNNADILTQLNLPLAPAPSSATFIPTSGASKLDASLPLVDSRTYKGTGVCQMRLRPRK
jgi:hypothetical protein